MRFVRPLFPVVLLALTACPGDATPPADFEVTATYPHDRAAYTQGLIWADGVLYESVGRYANSDVRRVDLATGAVQASTKLSTDKFGEGLALLGGKLYQLTWKEEVAYVYDAATLAPLDSFRYAGEGWGLATDGTDLWMSDGSDSLRLLDPASFAVKRVVKVRLNGMPLVKINEMEWDGGTLLANVYETDQVVRIDPASGEVLKVYDFEGLYPDRPPEVDVLNGIAHSPVAGEYLITGKYWPTLYRVKLK